MGIRKIFLLALAALIVITLTVTTITYGGGKKKMEIKYDANGEMTLTPQFYGVGKSLSLFPVPQDNAVGTNDYKNAITIISFPKGKMDTDNYFKGAVDRIGASGTYLPVISPEMIGFGQERRFLLFNFKNKTHEEYRVVFPIDETIQKIGIADPQKRHFIFEINESNRHSEDWRDSTSSLQLIDLTGKDVKLIKKINIGQGSIWAVAYGKLFLWFFDEKIMQVYDMNLEPSQHPLGDVIKQNKNRLDFMRIAPHPYLPFAILHGGKRDETVISWGEGKIKTPQPFINNGKYFSFSPDGKWVAFQKEDYQRDKKMTYLMPVSEKYPNYLGTPILLWDNYFTEDKFAWTNNPISFVGSSGYAESILRWELTNETYPESDKPTFHDYIVEKDLEKLAKEKKQGLGK